MPDVAIVGAGLIGAGIAYELAQRGASVTLFDRAEPARAASWAGAGMLAPFSEELPDAAMLALCRASLALYPEFVADLHERSGVDAKLLACGTLHVALDDVALEHTRANARTYATNGGDVRLLDRAEMVAREPALARDVRGGAFIANEAQVDNRRLGRALIAACERMGVRLERTRTLAIEADARRVRGIRTAHGFVAATTIVNAAGAWAGDIAGVPDEARVPVFPVAGEMLAIAVPPHIARALLWLEHTYLVPRDDGRLLVGATVRERGFDVTVSAAGIRDLLANALRVAPVLGTFAIVETWAGLRPGTPDKRPFIGATPVDGYFVAAGHYRNGILLTPITARAIADLITCGDTDIPLDGFGVGRETPERPLDLANVAR